MKIKVSKFKETSYKEEDRLTRHNPYDFEKSLLSYHECGELYHPSDSTPSLEYLFENLEHLSGWPRPAELRDLAISSVKYHPSSSNICVLSCIKYIIFLRKGTKKEEAEIVTLDYPEGPLDPESLVTLRFTPESIQYNRSLILPQGIIRKCGRLRSELIKVDLDFLAGFRVSDEDTMDHVELVFPLEDLSGAILIHFSRDEVRYRIRESLFEEAINLLSKESGAKERAGDFETRFPIWSRFIRGVLENNFRRLDEASYDSKTLTQIENGIVIKAHPELSPKTRSRQSTFYSFKKAFMDDFSILSSIIDLIFNPAGGSSTNLILSKDPLTLMLNEHLESDCEEEFAISKMPRTKRLGKVIKNLMTPPSSEPIEGVCFVTLFVSDFK